MNAEILLDSLKIRQALDAFSAAWRSKTATEGTRTQAFQEVLDLIAGSSKGRTPGLDPGNVGSTPAPARPVLKPKPDMEVFTDPESAGVTDFDPFVHPEEQANINPNHAMILQAHEATKEKPVGSVVLWKMPEDFNPNRAQQYINEVGLPYEVIEGGISLDTTLSMSGRPDNAPAPGWIVKLTKMA